MAGREGDISSDWDSSDDEVNTGQEPGVYNPGPQAVHLEANPDSPGFGVLNEYVMDHLLRFLPVNDLKNCRLVNSSWKQACLKVIPKTGHVVQIPSAVGEINRLISVISSSSGHFPWTKFELNCFEIETAEQERATGTLIGTIASFATSIHLSSSRSTIPMLPRNLEYPALKQFNMSVQQVLESGFGFVRTMLERAPSLDVLELSGKGMMERWMELLGVPNVQNISSLHLNSDIADQHLIRLSELSLQLKYLHLTFWPNGQGGISSETLKTFLGSQSAYLEKLELMEGFFGYFSNGYFRDLEFPLMPKLTALKIGITSEFPNISYAELFPVLRKLEFAFGVMREEMELDFFNEDIQPVESVTELIFCDEEVGCCEIMEGGRQFPNLRKVALPNEQKLLECMSMSMPNVEELWLICENLGQNGRRKDVDPELCGITQGTYKELQKLPSGQLKVWKEFLEPPHCLKRLKKLRLIPRESKLHLGEIGCRYGLLKLERLEILELAGNCSDVSNKVMKALKKKFTVILTARHEVGLSLY